MTSKDEDVSDGNIKFNLQLLCSLYEIHSTGVIDPETVAEGVFLAKDVDQVEHHAVLRLNSRKSGFGDALKKLKEIILEM